MTSGEAEPENMSRSRSRVLGRIVLVLFFVLLACAGLGYYLRFTLVAWYLDGSRQVEATVMSEITNKAPAVIERELHMTIPQSILSFFAGKRGEEARERDALKDTEAFTELAFKNRWLRFRNVHRQTSIKGFALRGSDVALAWVRGGGEDVLAAFHVHLWKRKASGFLLNEQSGFFTDLTQYVEARAKKN